MQENTFQYGMIGAGTMGKNLVLNMCDHGFKVAVFDRTPSKAEALKSEFEGKMIDATASLNEFVSAIKKPRCIFLLVPAGEPVDGVIEQLKPMVDKDDLIVDLGNSHFTDTNLRVERLAKEGLHFMGAGVSGGEAGARRGPSIMPGGDRDAYERVAPVLTAVSAKVNNEPCVAYLGPGSAGHYVKMVHNGIEYGIMQQIAEVYELLNECGGMSNDEISSVFDTWNKGPLQSYLVEITVEVLKRKDGPNYLVDLILDEAGQKGTGGWTSENALELGVPIPVIDAAVSARNISSFKDERVKASKHLKGPEKTKEDNKKLVSLAEQALQFSMITAYSQGMALLLKASKEYQYSLNLATIATIWRGGCIIRSAMLENIRTAFTKQPDLDLLMMDDFFAAELAKLQQGARQALAIFVNEGIPAPALSAAIAYYDAYRTARLPANLIQGLRDYFGAHTYKRIDKSGVFHTEWEQTVK